ncbi:vascular endothelial growth factor receptor 3-like isoform X2 [Anopheles albimanus]|uniref:vascular endothelial growth factor receptor 3-like isoform X2 n=1 Tax=Anopheles albimanus TaxID=7167 RepID=UPI0016414823|nr:vascular endothelial growth factor receptor 3-like isoform X2 [Anopheles albimanus]
MLSNESYLQAPPHITSTAFHTGDTENPHGANLTISYTSAAVVGRYYCVPSDRQDDDLEELQTEEIASSVYVFVQDYEQPLVPTPMALYTLKEKTFIPCKPSYPDVEVELCNKFKECLTNFNPTKGLTFSKSQLLLSEDDMLYCKSETASNTMRVLEKMIFPSPL